MFVVTCVLKVFSRNIVMTNISIHHFAANIAMVINITNNKTFNIHDLV